MNDEMKHHTAKLGSSRLIAHSLANRVLAQISTGKSKESIKKDLSQTKESLEIAQSAFFKKDPEAIAFLQLSDDDDDSDDDQIQIEETSPTEKVVKTDKIEKVEKT